MEAVVVLEPSPMLTVTIERQVENGLPRDEVHLHAGGQGCWIARMLTVLGVDVVVCAPLQGETGDVVATLMAKDELSVVATSSRTENACYVDDRRNGGRQQLALTPSPSLSRHDVDDLCSAFRSRALGSSVAVLAGAAYGDVMPADTYRRLAGELSRSGCRVVTDLSGAPLREALAGGVHLVKVSDEELVRDGWGRDGLAEVARSGAANVVVSSATGPTRALLDGAALVADGPPVVPADGSGAGDSMTAGLVTGLVRGLKTEEVLRLGVAAGALNAGRHGRGSGRREDVERMTEHVQVRRAAAPDNGVLGKDDLAKWVDVP